MSNLNSILSSLPNSPGVYQFFNSIGKIIYIGKSVNLKSRVNSYFNGKAKLNFAKQKMVEQIADIKYIITRNETESLILETNLIKEYSPKYNILMKDGKNHIYIKITDEFIPRIIKTRQKITHKTRFNEKGQKVTTSPFNEGGQRGEYYFGPYLSTYYVNNILKFIQKVFGYRTCNLKFELKVESGKLKTALNKKRKSIKQCHSETSSEGQNYEIILSNIGNTKIPCIYYYIKRCAGPCLKEKDKISEYQTKIEEIKDFLNGNTNKIKSKLEEEMKEKAKALKFEEAGKIKENLDSIKSLEETQIVREGVNGDFNIVNFVEKFDKFFIALMEIRNSKITSFYNYEIENKLGESKEEILKNFVESNFAKQLL